MELKLSDFSEAPPNHKILATNNPSTPTVQRRARTCLRIDIDSLRSDKYGNLDARISIGLRGSRRARTGPAEIY